MKPLKLQIVSNDGVEATIFTEVSPGDAGEYYTIVSVTGSIEHRKIYGVDPVQAFSLGLRLIEVLTEKKRIGEGDDDPVNGETWRIEVMPI